VSEQPGTDPRGSPDEGGGDRRRDFFQVLGVGAVDDDGEQSGVLFAQFGCCQVGYLTHLIRGSTAFALRGSTAEHEEYRSAEVCGDARVIGELGRAADVGEVGAKDQHRIAGALDGSESRHDVGERAIRIGVHTVVVDADAVLVRDVRAVVLEQQLEHVVGLGRRPRDRAEHTDSSRFAHQRLEHSEGDGRFARVPLGRGYVDASRHVSSLGIPAEWRHWWNPVGFSLVRWPCQRVSGEFA
jgi:hypothetical protein